MGVIKLHVVLLHTLELRTFLQQTKICLSIWESLVHYKIENPFNRRRFVKRLGGKLTLQHFKNRSEAATGNYASTRFAFGMKAFFSECRINMIIRDFSAKWKRLRMLAPFLKCRCCDLFSANLSSQLPKASKLAWLWPKNLVSVRCSKCKNN